MQKTQSQNLLIFMQHSALLQSPQHFLPLYHSVHATDYSQKLEISNIIIQTKKKDTAS